MHSYVIQCLKKIKSHQEKMRCRLWNNYIRFLFWYNGFCKNTRRNNTSDTHSRLPAVHLCNNICVVMFIKFIIYEIMYPAYFLAPNIFIVALI